MVIDADAQLSPTTLGQLLVTARRSITDEDDLVALLQRVAEIARKVIEGAIGYQAFHPPSTRNSPPVMYDADGVARKAIKEATSSGSA